MNLILTDRKIIPHTPSASGIELYDGFIFLMSDNSPWLYKFDEALKVVDRFQVYDVSQLSGSGTLSKDVKPDFEAMLRVPGCPVFYLFGSGSGPASRNILSVIDVRTGISQLHNLSRFYAAIKKSAGIPDDRFNIEAATMMGDNLLLFNRGDNRVFSFLLNAFQDFLMNGDNIPEVSVFQIHLPSISACQAGFSGATTIGDNLVITASVEDTRNWIDDGPILGSFISVLSFADFQNGIQPAWLLINPGNEPLKIESVAGMSVGAKRMQLLLAADNDQGRSDLLSGELTF